VLLALHRRVSYENLLEKQEDSRGHLGQDGTFRMRQLRPGLYDVYLREELRSQKPDSAADASEPPATERLSRLGEVLIRAHETTRLKSTLREPCGKFFGHGHGHEGNHRCYANSSCTTRPCTSVRRWFRPWYLNVRRV
jgi:hypothetical protein